MGHHAIIIAYGLRFSNYRFSVTSASKHLPRLESNTDNRLSAWPRALDRATVGCTGIGLACAMHIIPLGLYALYLPT